MIFSSQRFFQKTNEQIRLYYLPICFRSFFWKKVKTPKRHFEIKWPLVGHQKLFYLIELAWVVTNSTFKLLDKAKWPQDFQTFPCLCLVIAPKKYNETANQIWLLDKLQKCPQKIHFNKQCPPPHLNFQTFHYLCLVIAWKKYNETAKQFWLLDKIALSSVNLSPSSSLFGTV